jgi:hypothetical protein
MRKLKAYANQSSPVCSLMMLYDQCGIGQTRERPFEALQNAPSGCTTRNKTERALYMPVLANVLRGCDSWRGSDFLMPGAGH